MAAAKPLLPAERELIARDAAEAVTGADALVLVTEWNEFRALAPARLRELMRGEVVVDLRNVFDPMAMRAAGFAYQGIGRANENHHDIETESASRQHKPRGRHALKPPDSATRTMPIRSCWRKSR